MARKSTTKLSAAPPKGADAAGSPTAARGKIRMYRQGLGDCFLVTLARQHGDPYRILIDCGVILGTKRAGEIMTQVMDNVLEETDSHIDLLVATHQHWDHLSGFIQAEDSFAKLNVDKVWVAWTEDPNDRLANELRDERKRAISALRLAGSAMTMAGDADQAAEIDALVGFFGAAGGHSTEDALKIAMAKADVRYCRPADDPVHLSDPDVRFYILGPPPDAKQIRRTLPSTRNPETYGVSAHLPAADVASALSAEDRNSPFDGLRPIPFASARGMDFFRRRYWGPGEDAPAWRMVDTAWLDGASELALALDSATNNTSLVLAIEFVADGEVLLFVADAQVGNWLSWQDLSWNVDGKRVTGPDLLARTIFYKVGHHGSHNATLRDKGLDLMKNLLVAAVPVNHQMALDKNWGNMPLPALLEALKAMAKVGVVRIDETPARPIPGIASTGLYFDISI
ncbi:hypothetical protein NKJ87_29070 [Mesorhizobium sp. M0027]|uniref:hypothetical protein n=1 Tax=unclassified Mesorhizobium TaxID=325217 RepID=UPI003339F02B